MHMLIFICFDKNEIIPLFLLCSYHNTMCNHFVSCNVWNIAYEICIFVCELVIYIFVVNHIQVYTLTSHFLFIFQPTIVIHKTIGCNTVQYKTMIYSDHTIFICWLIAAGSIWRPNCLGWSEDNFLFMSQQFVYLRMKCSQKLFF